MLSVPGHKQARLWGAVEIDPDNQVPNLAKMEKVHLSYGAVIFTD